MRCLLSKMPRRVGHWLNGTRPASTSATSNVTLNDFSTIDKGAIAVVSKTNEIHFNLAFEHYLMDVVKPRVALFFWWQNASTVVIGRHQNAWKECDLEQMAKDKVDLARRFSGGGAVYQDLGNSCFTFLIPDHLYQQSINNAIILNVLKKTYNIHGEPSGRNDLVVNEKKVGLRTTFSYAPQLTCWAVFRLCVQACQGASWNWGIRVIFTSWHSAHRYRFLGSSKVLDASQAKVAKQRNQ